MRIWWICLWLVLLVGAGSAAYAETQSPAPGEVSLAVDPRYEAIKKLQNQLGIKDGKLPGPHRAPKINYFGGSWSRVKIIHRVNQVLEQISDFWQAKRRLLRLLILLLPLALAALVAAAAYELHAPRLTGFLAGFAINLAITAVILEMMLLIYLGLIARQPLWPIEEFTLLLFPAYWLLATVIPAKLMLGWDAELAVIPRFLIGLLLPMSLLAALYLPDFFARHRTGSLWVIGITCGVAIVGLILAVKIGARRMA